MRHANGFGQASCVLHLGTLRDDCTVIVGLSMQPPRKTRKTHRVLGVSRQTTMPKRKPRSTRSCSARTARQYDTGAQGVFTVIEGCFLGAFICMFVSMCMSWSPSMLVFAGILFGIAGAFLRERTGRGAPGVVRDGPLMVSACAVGTGVAGVLFSFKLVLLLCVAVLAHGVWRRVPKE